MQTSHIEAFRTAIAGAGLIPPDAINDDGKLVRFNGLGKRGNNRSSWYVLFQDGVPAGKFGDWAQLPDGIAWTGKPDNQLTDSERQAIQQRMQEAQRQRDEEHAQRQEEAAILAERLWRHVAGAGAGQHPYIKGKGINAYGAKMARASDVREHSRALSGELKGDLLVIPMRCAEGKLRNLQFITADGIKRPLTGGRIKGCYHAIGKLEGEVIVCEGFATGASIHAATRKAVAVAFNAGNMQPVAQALREKYPDLQITLAADDDAQTPGNPGIKAATAAAQAVGGAIVVPDFGDSRPEKATDFNDLHQHQGEEAVATAFEVSAWPALDVLEEEEAPTPHAFPFHALGPVLGAAARAIAEDVQAPDSLAGGSVLAAASLAAQPLANVMLPHGLRAPLSVFVVTGAGSGDRKSAVDAVACREVEEVRKQQAREYTRALEAYEADKAAKKKGDEDPDKPAPKSLTTSNATIEGICKLLKYQSHVGIFSAEGGEMLGGHSLRDDKRSSGLAFYLKGWSGESLDSLRGGDGLTVLLGRRMAMHVLVQPVLLGQLLCDPLAQGQGLLARCLIAQPDSLAGHRLFRDVDPQENPAVIAYNERIRAMLNTSPTLWAEGDGYELKPRDLGLSPEARALWIAFYNEIERQQANGSELEGARPFASKAAEHAARIAGIITLVEDPTASTIAGQAMDGAIQLTAFYLTEHLRLTGAGRQERHDGALRALLHWLQERGALVAKKDVLQRSPRAIRNLKAAGINALLADLAQRGYIREAGEHWEVRHV
ncbi:DUF3987 domain-containing protein [Diaphorobacter nitroreducens]|uniref:DUF3987 domain-containing protein n=1 Tax=Diaphorobacter nitroreducens TaxID=164759 RepID=UPI0028A1ED04|nr:DUF3987 domain-containing protein [Diaphorobacter nitroreducens]